MMIMDNLSFSQIMAFAIALSVIFASIASIFYVIKWWISAIFASGDPEKIKEALHTVRYAITWLVIVFLSVVIIKIVWAIFWINLTQYLNVEDVQSSFGTIIERLNWNYWDTKPLSVGEDVLEF